MTTQEFSNEFDTLLNSYAEVDEFGKVHSSFKLDEYEKSIYLTKAQEDLILGIYKGIGDFNSSFEETEEARRYLNNLIVTYKTSTQVLNKEGLVKNSVFYSLPQDLWFITYESVDFVDKSLGCLSTDSILVVPTTLDEFYRINRNPFKGACDTRVLRLDIKDNISELISKYPIKSYLVRYLVKPTPIILEDFSDNISIEGIRNRTECKLNPALHRQIIEGACRMVYSTRMPRQENKNNV